MESIRKITLLPTRLLYKQPRMTKASNMRTYKMEIWFMWERIVMTKSLLRCFRTWCFQQLDYIMATVEATASWKMFHLTSRSFQCRVKKYVASSAPTSMKKPKRSFSKKTLTLWLYRNTSKPWKKWIRPWYNQHFNSKAPKNWDSPKKSSLSTYQSKRW